jgi:glycerol-3-phosphate dehydrogenase
MMLDSTSRGETIAALQAETWDVLVIGGGITGAGIACDACTRGMRVALVEMQDYAAGTSSRSTKLIHGGLRYLKQFEFGIVREVGRERAILHRNAGHIVHVRQMLLPIVEGGTFGKWGLWFGLWLYDRLAGVKWAERRKMLTAEQTLALAPQIDPKALQGAGYYTEYRTDDARLVMEILKSASNDGVAMLNYARVVSLTYTDGKVSGAVVEDRLTGMKFTIQAHVVVNAAGPWVDGLRALDNSLKGKRLHHTKGVHLVVPHARLPLQVAMYFDVGDGRMIFAIPRDQWTYFGTTDTDYKGALEHPAITTADVEYLIAAVNRMFPTANLSREDIESSWAGIRPLIHEDGKGPSQLSRKDELFHSESGLITIAGGKLTGYRKMAQKVVDTVALRLTNTVTGHDYGPCMTAEMRLPGFLYPDGLGVDGHAERLVAAFGIDVKEAQWLVGTFGSNADAVMALAGGHDRLAVLRGALRYCIRHEGVAQLGDFFVRRTAMLYFGRKWIAASLPTALEIFAEEFGIDYDADRGKVFEREYAAAVGFVRENGQVTVENG